MHKLQTQKQTFHDLKTNLNNTEQKILKFVEEYGKVCRKIIILKTDTCESAIYKNTNNLIDKDLLEENCNKALKLTDKGLAQVS